MKKDILKDLLAKPEDNIPSPISIRHLSANYPNRMLKVN